MKINNPLKIENLPSHMTEGRDAHYRFLYITMGFAFALAYLSLVFGPMIEMIWPALWRSIKTATWNRQITPFVAYYANAALSFDFTAMYVKTGYMRSINVIEFQYDSILKLVGYFLGGFFVGMTPQLFNSHIRIVTKAGFADWCDDETLKKMEARKQVGIEGGFLLTLGRWRGKQRQGQMVRMIETLSALCLAPPGTGKCLHPDEPVLMYDGSLRRTGDLAIGDLLMGPDSLPRRVLATTPGRGALYRVTPAVGRSWICNGDHILSLRSDGDRDDAAPIFATVRDWLSWPMTRRQKTRLWRVAVDFAAQPPLPLPAYEQGLAIAAVAADASALLPPACRTAARDERLDLIAGLIDAAGGQDVPAHAYDLSFASRRLADDIAFIARTLGLNAALRARYENDALLWNVEIGGDVGILPVRQFAAPPRLADGGLLNAFDIEPIGEGPYFGIIIDRDRQYLLDDCTVTHNTAAFVVPSIVTCDNVSFLVNDVKPELYEMTSGHRSTVSHVFMLDWSKVDYYGDNDNEALYYPRFNFLSPRLVPAMGPNRDTYIDAVSKVMIPEPKGGGDSYFVNKGRAALTGFIHYLIAKIESGDYEGIPPEWRGKEPSLAMLSDWIAFAQLEQTKPGDDDEDAMTTESADKLGAWIRQLTDEVKNDGQMTLPNGKKKFPAPRAFLELSSLVNMADKERSGILGTMDQALLSFKNEAVKQRTEACDFTADDFRGIFDPEIAARTQLPPDHPNYLNPGRRRIRTAEGFDFVWESEEYRDLYMDAKNWKPVTLYVCINQAEAPAFATITALLYEVLVTSHLSFGPWDYNEKTDRILGPFAICYMLDEFPKLPKTEAVMKAPDLGRSKKVSIVFVGQSKGQLELIYSKADQEVLISTTAIKYVLPQNDPESIKLIQSMAGKTTILRTSRSTQQGLSKAANPYAWSESENLEEADFLRYEDIGGLQPGLCIVLAQGFLNRPMKLVAPFFFEDPAIAALVRSRGKGPIGTTIMPDYSLARRKLEETAANDNHLKQESQLQAQARRADPKNLEDLLLAG